MSGFPSGFFPSGFPTKTLCAPLLSPYALHVPPISDGADEQYRSQSSSLCSILHFILMLCQISIHCTLLYHLCLRIPSILFLSVCASKQNYPKKNKHKLRDLISVSGKMRHANPGWPPGLYSPRGEHVASIRLDRNHLESVHQRERLWRR